MKLAIIFFALLHSMLLLAIFILLLIMRCLYSNIVSPSPHWYDDTEPDDIPQKQGFNGGHDFKKKESEIPQEQIIWFPDEYLTVNPEGEQLLISNSSYPRYTFAMDGAVYIPNSYRL